MEIRELCHAWAGMQGTSGAELARVINGAGFLVTLDVDAWADSQGGAMHVAALTYRPSPLSVAALGVVSPTRAGAHDAIVSDAVSSPPEFIVPDAVSSPPDFAHAAHGARASGAHGDKMLLFGHPAHGGQTSFVSPLAQDATGAPRAPPPVRAWSTAPQDRARAQGVASRKALGFSEDALILGCFHAEYKVSRDLVAAAASLLRRHARGVLWLGFMSAVARARIERELLVHGVAAARTRTAMLPGNIEGAGHLEAKALVDVALDSPVYSGHSSTADLVWAAVPTLTSPGVAQTTRLAASILLSQPVPAPHSVGRGAEAGVQAASRHAAVVGDAAVVGASLARNPDDLAALGHALMGSARQLAHVRARMAGLRVNWGAFEVSDWRAEWHAREQGAGCRRGQATMPAVRRLRARGWPTMRRSAVGRRGLCEGCASPLTSWPPLSLPLPRPLSTITWSSHAPARRRVDQALPPLLLTNAQQWLLTTPVSNGC